MIIIASLKDIICTGVIRCLNKVYASEFVGKLTGNADTAATLATARNIAISGAVTGNANFDGSGNINISTSVNHSHNYAKKSSVVNVTLSSSSWSGSSAPYTYAVSVSGVTTSNIVEVIPSSSITDTQVKALMSANVAKATQASGKITLYAYGDKPTVNIPITVSVRGDVESEVTKWEHII